MVDTGLATGRQESLTEIHDRLGRCYPSVDREFIERRVEEGILRRHSQELLRVAREHMRLPARMREEFPHLTEKEVSRVFVISKLLRG